MIRLLETDLIESIKGYWLDKMKETDKVHLGTKYMGYIDSLNYSLKTGLTTFGQHLARLEKADRLLRMRGTR